MECRHHSTLELQLVQPVFLLLIVLDKKHQAQSQLINVMDEVDTRVELVLGSMADEDEESTVDDEGGSTVDDEGELVV